MTKINLYTIGFTQKSAELFFGKIEKAGVQKIIDVRLNNTSQLAGFSKKNDLIYFLKTICGCGYRHETLLAPTKQILEAYKKKMIGWTDYENQFNDLLPYTNRGIATCPTRAIDMVRLPLTGLRPCRPLPRCHFISAIPSVVPRPLSEPDKRIPIHPAPRLTVQIICLQVIRLNHFGEKVNSLPALSPIRVRSVLIGYHSLNSANVSPYTGN